MESMPWWAHGFTVIATILVVGKGARWIVEGAVRICEHLGVSELVVGLTVVRGGRTPAAIAVGGDARGWNLALTQRGDQGRRAWSSCTESRKAAV